MFEEDGRVFAKRMGKQRVRYDLVMLDAFDHEYIPEHLLTREFLLEIKGLLAERGVLAANTFASSRLYDFESATYFSVFGDFYRLKRGNRVILAREGGLPDREELGRNADSVEERLRPFGVGKEWLLPLFAVESGWPKGTRRPHRPVFAVEFAEWIDLNDRQDILAFRPARACRPRAASAGGRRAAGEFRRPRAPYRRRSRAGSPHRGGATVFRDCRACHGLGDGDRSGRSCGARRRARHGARRIRGWRSVAAWLEAEPCTDAIRADVARRTADPDRRRAAMALVRDEKLLVELALTAEIAETRQDAAERVHSPEGLRKLADAAKNKDRGVARLARQRLDAMADACGPAERRRDSRGAGGAGDASRDRSSAPWSTSTGAGRRLDEAPMSHAAPAGRGPRGGAGPLRPGAGRAARARAVRAPVARMARGAAAACTRTNSMRCAASSRRCARRRRATTTAPRSALLEEAEQRIAAWERDRHALAGAEALVVEAEQLAAGTSIDHADLPARWAALDRAMRTPALTQRFEAALIIIEQRRLAQIQAAQQLAGAARQHVHSLLHTAEQALAAGQLQAARAAADEIRTAKAAAGVLPKPTVQRLGRLVQQLTELERWESFGQRQARIQLCERAEALATATHGSVQARVEVQKLRNEWKALDEQHAGVPKAVWERFDGACEKAYAPAARHFAEMAAQRKEGRRKREEFIAAAAAHVPTLLVEPRDWRAIERWLRETDKGWREGDLGSVEPGAWKKLDARFKAALAAAARRVVRGTRSGEDGARGADRRGRRARGTKRWNATRLRR